MVDIQDLDLCPPHQEHPAVTAALAIPTDLGRSCLLDVELAVTELFLRLNVSRAGHALHTAITNHPLLAILRLVEFPAGKVGPIEEYYGIRRRRSGHSTCSLDNLQMRAISVMHRPWMVRIW